MNTIQFYNSKRIFRISNAFLLVLFKKYFFTLYPTTTVGPKDQETP